MPNRMHADQVDIDADLVRRLLRAQLPALAGLPLAEAPAEGTVNAIYRLGEELCVRLPLVARWVASLERELTWLPWLAPRLPVPIPEPVETGVPAEGYPFPWAVYRWLPGTTAVATDRPGGVALAEDLVGLIAALRALDPAGAPRSDGRHRLRPHDPWIRTCLTDLAPDADEAATTAAWDAALAAPIADGPLPWIHSDLLPTNLLVAHGRLAGVIDWGLVGTGDPAADLVPAWTSLDTSGRRRLRAGLDVDDAAWARGRGWALRMAIGAIPYYRTSNPVFAAMGRRTVDEVLWGERGADG